MVRLEDQHGLANGRRENMLRIRYSYRKGSGG